MIDWRLSKAAPSPRASGIPRGCPGSASRSPRPDHRHRPWSGPSPASPTARPAPAARRESCPDHPARRQLQPRQIPDRRRGQPQMRVVRQKAAPRRRPARHRRPGVRRPGHPRIRHRRQTAPRANSHRPRPGTTPAPGLHNPAARRSPARIIRQDIGQPLRRQHQRQPRAQHLGLQGARQLQAISFRIAIESAGAQAEISGSNRKNSGAPRPRAPLFTSPIQAFTPAE
jgi:hypothetical protein